MGYELKIHEWDLTEEEQEQARYILKAFREERAEEAVKCQTKTGERMTGTLGVESEAFEDFKCKFYSTVRCRLNPREISPWPFAFGVGCLSFNDDCTKLLGYRIEKVE